MKRRQNGGGPKLPLTLQKELHIDTSAASFSRRRIGNGNIGSRRHGGGNRRRLDTSDDSLEGPEKRSSSKPEQKSRHVDAREPLRTSLGLKGETPKLTASTSHEPDSLPDLKLDRASKTFRYRAAEDDAEIAALEKKLGVKGKKKPQSFNEDGLDDLLMDLDSPGEGDGSGAYDELERQRASKRRRVSRKGASQPDDEGLDEPTSSPELSDSGFGETDDESNLASEEPRAQRENPYVAPPSTEQSTTRKYVPPSLRKRDNTDQDSSQRLRRQLQGQINRLSETNMLSILKEVEKLYQQNARQDVTSALTDQLLVPFCERSALQTTFTILHAAFLTALYKVVGTEFGVHVVSTIVEHLETFHGDSENSGKQGVNLLSLLCHLYTFRMISSHLIFDHIHMLLLKLDERNSEILLRIVRDSGPQLRQDDPSSLKTAVILVQNEMAQAREKVQVISVRTQFMVETIIDLRNNKLRHETGSAGVAKEHIVLLRKLLGSMVSRSLRAPEPMRLSLSDLKDAGKRGQWLRTINGTGTGTHQEDEREADADFPQRQADQIMDDPDFLLLARQNGMNTLVRRAIFTALISSNDHQDARSRLLSLRLKKSQQQEIPRVLLHCVGLEEQYNPYYTLIAKELCLSDKKLKMGFQFALWSFFKRMGETGEAGDDADADAGGEEVQPREIVNLAKTYATLITSGVLSLDILKVLNLRVLTPQLSLFVDLMLGSILLKAAEDSEDQSSTSIFRVFGQHAQHPKLAAGLRRFLGKVVKHTELFESKREKKVIKQGCAVAMEALKGADSDGQVIE